MRRSLAALLFSPFILATSAAVAGPEPGDWYIAPKGVWVITDDERGLRNDAGVQLSLGRVLSPAWDFEISGITSLHDKPGGKHDSLEGGSLAMNRVFARGSRVNPFIGFGLGYLDDSNGLSNDEGVFGSLSVGLTGDLAQFAGGRLQWQTDMQARRMTSLPIGSNITDYIAGLGFRLVFGSSGRTAPVMSSVAPLPPSVAIAPPLPDTDRDGVADEFDKCPDTTSGTAVDTDGCALDVDRDGVFNVIDKCPATPSGDRVDAFGCSLRSRLQVFFATGSAVLMPESATELDQLAAFLGEVTGARGTLEGHTDNTGSAAFNQRLSRQRADAVRRYLVGKGVDAGRLQVEGYGESRPEADNSTEQGRSQNRRVIFQRTDIR